jgi:hypothetical protein
MDERPQEQAERVDKPVELLALHGVTAEMFAMLKSWFSVPDELPLDLTDIDAAVRSMGDPVMIAALAMRKLQALRLLSTPGVVTTTDVVVTIISDLRRALLQAPVMRLHLAAARTDWDAELAGIDGCCDCPSSSDAVDAAAQRFRALHLQIERAGDAVLDACRGEVRELL